jgi:two-component system sensor histidine kinase DesK
MATKAGRTGHAAPDTGGIGASGTGGIGASDTGYVGATWANRTGDRRRGLLTNPRGLSLMRAPGTGSAQRWFFSGIWLIYLVSPVADLFSGHHSPLWVASGLVITIAFSAIYLTILCNSDRWPRQSQWGLAAIAALAALACVVYGKDWTPLWIYVSAATGMVLAAPAYGPRTAMYGVLAVSGCYVFFSWLAHVGIGEFLAVLLPVVLVGAAMIGFRMQIQLTHELTQARETVAKLAANEERLRLARDMHDLTGQSLSTITLKSELAAKRLSKLPVSAERDTVLGDLGDIGRVSRQTLHDIREAVSGYRRPTLAIEAITARNALEAAGIRLDDDPGLTLRSGTFDADAEAVLAWCLREAVTNVIRHSGARTCRIRLIPGDHELSLEVSDDGHGPASQEARDPSALNGAGLRGMSERLGTAGGRLTLGAADPGPNLRQSHGFRLTATVPVDHYDD